MDSTTRPGPSPDTTPRLPRAAQVAAHRTPRTRARIGHRAALLAFAVLAATTLSAAVPMPLRAVDSGVGITPVADTWVQFTKPNTNHGSATELRARKSRTQTYVKFDLNEWYGQPLSRMDLQISVTGGAPKSLRLQLSRTGWSEDLVTWFAQPGMLASPTVSIGNDGGQVQKAGVGPTSINVSAFFPSGKVDRRMLSIRLTSLATRNVRFESRETSRPPRLVMWGLAETTDTITQPEPSQPSQPAPMRFYTPNIIARGDNENPPRDTDPTQMAALFKSSSDMAPVLKKVDMYGFFGSSLGRGDPAYDAMVKRAIPMLAAHGVKLGLEVGGPLGYNPGVVYGGDRKGENGRKSALFDVNARVGKIESMGGRVDYLMLDGALRRTIRNGVHKNPHAAFVTIGTAANANALTYRAKTVGAQGNSIRVTYVLEGNNRSLSVAVSGTDIVVRLATDSSGKSTSTASNVKAAVEASSAAASLVSVSHHGGSSGAGIVPVRAATALAWGDDGLNMTIGESVNELVSYIHTVNQARPNIRFVLLEDVILWPYDGKPGYASVAYPSQQRPDFKVVWEELVRSLRSAGLMNLLVGFHNDGPVEYFDRVVPSIHRTADDWYGRILKQQAQVEASGVAFGQQFNSFHGGTPSSSKNASDSYFQSQVLHHVQQVEAYRQANRPGMARMEHFVIDAFMYYPRVVTPSTKTYSTDATYLKALEHFLTSAAPVSLFESAQVAAAPVIPLSALRPGRGLPLAA